MSKRKYADRKPHTKRWVKWKNSHKKQLDELMAKSNGKCSLCGCTALIPKKGIPTTIHDGNHLTFDHIIPLADGGEPGIDNIRVICFTCNNLLSRYVSQRKNMEVAQRTELLNCIDRETTASLEKLKEILYNKNIQKA